ncbi:MAG: hypothetical protein K0R57_3417 [Paenibacillaceae bacterium]|jgi:nitroreductase|nr:hypothetical protein [Paenibacillaceae bacterium]
MTKLSRRSFLKGTAAAVALLSAGGVIRAVDQGGFSTGRGPAYEAWKHWESHDYGGDPLLRLVKTGVLAASAHNTQPWLFRVSGQKLQLFADISRNLGAMDPCMREMNLSLGCALENLMLAAAAYGYKPQETLYNGGPEQILAADIALSPGTEERSGLYAAIGRRHTNRGAYDKDRPVQAAVLQELDRLGAGLSAARVIWFSSPAEKAEMGSLVIRATEAIAGDSQQTEDSHRWYRQDWQEIQRHKDGPTMDATGNPALTRFFGKLLPVSAKTSNAYWLKMTKGIQVPTAAVFGTIVVRDRRERSQLLQAGRLWQRLHLWAAGNGLAAQPLNQPHERQDRELQEGSEPVFGQALQNLVNAPGYESVFTFRMGYPLDQALRSPRRPAREVMLTYI